MTKKGVWVAIRTLRALPPDCDLILAGGGEDRGLVESHIRSRGLGDRIRVFPQLSPEEWAKIYHQCSLVIMPCLWNEPLGLGALRAMAYGKPVVAFRSGGLPDWLEDGFNGLLLPTEQRKHFPEAVASLLNHPEELARMGKNALGLWQKHHRMESHLDALLASYQSLLSR